MNKNAFCLLILLSLSLNAHGVTVAVIDSGLDVSHEAIREALWHNPGESGTDDQGRNKATNQIDDDGNGFVDDVHGWDFVTQSSEMVDANGHGTHVTGLILGFPELDSTSRSVRILSLRYFDPAASGSTNLQRSIEALEYAVNANVDIINYSGGGMLPDPREEALIRRAAAKGILIVSAAGNQGHDLDKQQFYPASYPVKNVITVAALNRKGQLLSASNFGKNVHYLALGENVNSLMPGKQMGAMTGTSQATALVTRKLALALSQQPDLKSAPNLLHNHVGLRAPASLLGKTPFARLLAVKDPTNSNRIEAQGFAAAAN